MKYLKGEGFINRYRITGRIKTLSPLHVGSGVDDPSFLPNKQNDKQGQTSKEDDVPAVATILRDHAGKPLIPGSTLRGVMRHWLLHVLGGFSPAWAAIHDYQEQSDTGQEDVIKYIKDEFSWLELLFGTPLHAGKLEVWDALCTTSVSTPPGFDKLLHWKDDRLTYVDTSVAIDPTRGTAQDKLLYQTEIVPPGVEFELNIAGQNLSDEEMGMILLALQGFNSAIYPIRVGARGGRGYGRVHFMPEAVYYLDKDNLAGWIKDTLNNFGDTNAAVNAGYYNLPKLSAEKQAALIQRVKDSLKQAVDG